MHSANSDELQALLARFVGFEDAVVRRVTALLKPGGEGTARVVLSAFDTAKDPLVDDGWANVVFEILGVREMSLSFSLRGQNEVLEGGLHVSSFEGLTFVTLNSWRPPATVVEARAARGYIAGTGCRWEIKPYAESAT
jgi:hypothetical protein